MKNVFWKENKIIKELLQKIEALNIAYTTLKPLTGINKDLLRRSLLKSALFSARIEGNPLTLSEINTENIQRNSKNLHKKEISNLFSAYLFIESKRSPKSFSKELILKLHELVMKDISSEAGKFRKEQSAIFNQAGIAVYLAPSPLVINGLISELVSFSLQEPVSALVKSALVQFAFEKIHPFIDGNGRVGRLFSAFILSKKGYFSLAASLEEYIDENRDEYYYALEPSKDATLFVEFFLKALLKTAKDNFSGITLKENEGKNDLLLPRRKEILAVIKDHPDCSFDFISRRFGNVNPKTLHYDLKKLQEKGFIFKIGNTRGALYQAKN